MIVTRIILSCIMLALLAPPAAQAGWRTDRALAVAEKVWQAPCGPGGVSLSYADPPGGFEPRALMAATVGHGCVVWVNPRVSFRDRWGLFCHAVIHEVGHLAGREHSEDRRSVMHALAHGAGKWKVVVNGRSFGYVPDQEAGHDRRCRNRGADYLGVPR